MVAEDRDAERDERTQAIFSSQPGRRAKEALALSRTSVTVPPRGAIFYYLESEEKKSVSAGVQRVATLLAALDERAKRNLEIAAWIEQQAWREIRELLGKDPEDYQQVYRWAMKNIDRLTIEARVYFEEQDRQS